MEPIIAIGEELKAAGYKFTTITPNSHARVMKRYGGNVDFGTDKQEVLRQLFGWNLYFDEEKLDGLISDSFRDRLRNGLLKPSSPNSSSKKTSLRFSTHNGLIFAHTSFPTVESDSIFFGPDTYRYFNFIQNTLRMNSFSKKSLRLIDIGAGSGAGGLYLAQLVRSRQIDVDLVLTDINPRALQFCRASAQLNFGTSTSDVGVKFSYLESDILKQVDGTFDVIISNPPYMVDTDASDSRSSIGEASSRIYRDGGGSLGIDLAVRIAREGMDKLNDGGIIGLYTGIPIIKGADPFFEAIKQQVQDFNGKSSNGNVEIIEYSEIDPDVWGEELETKAYGDVDRIAVVGLTIRRNFK